MRKRYQKGSLRKVGGTWVAQWWEDGRRKKKFLGRPPQVTKAEAQAQLAVILAPINARHRSPSQPCSLQQFFEQVYLPFYRRKWKRSTALSNEDRIRRHVVAVYGSRALGSFSRDELQSELDKMGGDGLSYSTVAHIRWDLKQMFGMAVNEGYVSRNPAELLFVPRECPRPDTAVMTVEQIRLMMSVLDLREQVIAGLAIGAGMRPGEVFALKWNRLGEDYADIRQRVYRGGLDSPKTVHSVRRAALSDGLADMLERWRAAAILVGPDDWVFVGENLKRPLSKDHCWRTRFKPRLQAIGLEWVNFLVFRKTHNCLLKELDVDPKVRAEQLGHTVDVNENVYTKTSLQRRKEAVNRLEVMVKPYRSILEP